MHVRKNEKGLGESSDCGASLIPGEGGSGSRLDGGILDCSIDQRKVLKIIMEF